MFPPSSYYLLVETYEQDRHRHEERRHAIARALASDSVPGPSWTMRFKNAIANIGGRDHSLTDYACRLPDGRLGRVAAIEQNGEWSLVCRAV